MSRTEKKAEKAKTEVPKIKGFFRSIFVIFLAFVLWFEESLWDVLKSLTHRLAQTAPVRCYENWLGTLAPYPTLLVFFLPGLLLLPVKVAALWLIAHGLKVGGLLMILAAKVCGTAVAARSFVICKPKMLTIPWFARLYQSFLDFRQRLSMRIAAWKQEYILSRSWYLKLRTVMGHIRRRVRDAFGAAHRR